MGRGGQLRSIWRGSEMGLLANYMGRAGQFIKNEFLIYLLIVILILSLIVGALVILYTLIDLATNYSFDISKEGIITFLDAFNWKYITPSFVALSAYITLSTYKTHEKNRIYNNVVKPHADRLTTQLEAIREDNKLMFTHFSRYGENIIASIYNDEKTG
jgi:hypothetical protein